MKYILSIIFSFFFFLAYGQDTVFMRYNTADYDKPVLYKTDTLIFDNSSERERKILIGTTVLPWTNGQMVAKHYGINFLKKVTLEPCENAGRADELENKIISITETDNELIVSIEISANCCHSFLGDVDIIDGNTINLITHGYGAWCACMCCFGLTFHFDITKEGTYLDYKNLEYITINGQEGTRKKIK